MASPESKSIGITAHAGLPKVGPLVSLATFSAAGAVPKSESIPRAKVSLERKWIPRAKPVFPEFHL